MDAIGPDVDVALRRQIAPLPRSVFVKPPVLQTADGGCRQPGSILAEQRRQSLGEVAGGDTLQVKDRQQRLDRFRAAHVGRQDRRREPDAVGVGSVRLAIAYTRLADDDRTDTGHHLAFRQVTVAHDALVAIRCLQIGMLAEKIRYLGLDRLSQQSTRPIAQDFGELIVDVSWLNQLDDVIFGHGISLLRWRSGGFKHPHDMPPSRFPPSPTFSDSSHARPYLSRMMRASRSFSHVFSFSRESIVRCRCSTSDGSLVTTGTASSATLLSVIIARLSAFDHRRALDIFGGQGLQSFLGFTVRYLVGMPTAFGGL